MRRTELLLALSLFFGVLGCASQPEERLTRIEPTRTLEPGYWRPIGYSAEGRPIRAWFRGHGSRSVLYMACIHGDEQSGRPLMEELIRQIDRRPALLEGRQVVVIPVANPDGYARRTRRNANGVDLNRNFGTANFEPGGDHGRTPASEPETRALCLLMRQREPDVIVTVHSPLTCVDYDGPAQGLAHRMSRRSGLPVKKLGSRAGSLGSYAGLERKIPTVTLELATKVPSESSSWSVVGGALLEALAEGETDRIGVAYSSQGSPTSSYVKSIQGE